MSENLENRISSTQAKEATFKAHSIQSSASEIDLIANEERIIPNDLNISLMPYFRVWKNKGTRKFETNIKTGKLFEDIFADKIVYVDVATGNDTTGNGTKTNPYKTIYKGVREKPFNPANGGKLTVYIKGGIYNGADGFNATGAYASEINIIAYDGLVYANHEVTTSYGYQVFESIKHYVEGIVFSGGKSPINFFNQANQAFAQFKNCKFTGATTENAINVRRNGLYIFENCIASNSALDGFNYHNSDTVKNQLVIEINCKGFSNGSIGVLNNGSTMHDNGNIIRINGEYYSNGNRNIHDVGSSKSLNLGCVSRDGIEANQGNFAVGTGINDTTKMWLDSCTSSGATNKDIVDFTSDSSSTIYTYDFVGTGGVASTTIPIEYNYKTVNN